ncbi:MAG: extracellular solute-binding protein [bacterium]
MTTASRIRALLTTMLLLFIVCRIKAESDNPTVRLMVWQGFKYNEVVLLRDNVAQFCRVWNASRKPQIEIDIQQVPFQDMLKKIKTAALARQTPDIVFVDANSMVPLVFGGVARELDTLANFPSASIDQLRTQYAAGAFDTNIVTLKGRRGLYGLPAQTTTLALFWNKKMIRARAAELKAAGLDPEKPPGDWEEFIRYGRILTQPQKGLYGFGMNNSFWFTMPFLNQYQAEVVRRNSDGMLEPALASRLAEAAINRKVSFWLKDHIEAGAWRQGALDPEQGFVNEKYAMILTGPWQTENFRSSKLDFGVALIPRVPLSEAKSLGLLPQNADTNSTAARTLTAGNIGGQNIVVSTQSKYPGIGLDFAIFFTSEPVQRRWAEELGQIPVLLAAQKNLKLDNFPQTHVFIEQISYAKSMPALPFVGALETDIINPEIDLVLRGRQSTMDAMKIIDQKIKTRILDPVNKAERFAREKRM